MNEKLCPYCYNKITAEENICHTCKKELDIQCPYCKQMIKAYDEVCPHCTTKLKKSFNPKFLIILGVSLSIIWLILQFTIITVLNYNPQILLEKNKHGELLFALPDYVNLVMQTMLISIIPYIIALVKKYKTRISTTGLIINIVISFCFISYFIYLYQSVK